MALRKPIETYQLLGVTATTAATGASTPVTLRDFDYNNLVFSLQASDVSATATLDVYVQTTIDGGSTWLDMIRFPRVTASASNLSWASANLGNLAVYGSVGAATVTGTNGATGVPLLSNNVRVYYALGGTTPSASFAVNAYETGFDRGGQ